MINNQYQKTINRRKKLSFDSNFYDNLNVLDNIHKSNLRIYDESTFRKKEFLTNYLINDQLDVFKNLVEQSFKIQIIDELKSEKNFLIKSDEMYSFSDMYNKQGFGIIKSLKKYNFDSNPILYEGYFIDGKKNGEGVERKDSCFFYGNFENNKKKGLGFTKENNNKIVEIGIYNQNENTLDFIVIRNFNETYIGEMYNGIRFGKAIHLSPYFRYEGEFISNRFNGFGTKFCNDSLQIGEFRNNDHVTGIHINYFTGKKIFFETINHFIIGYYQTNDYYFEGEFYLSLTIRIGSMYYKNGDYYSGEFSHNFLYEGYGIFIEKHSYIYEGKWSKNKKQGYGRIIYKNGNIYYGEFKSDKIEGYGEFCFENGNILKGKFNTDSEGKISCVSIL